MNDFEDGKPIEKSNKREKRIKNYKALMEILETDEYEDLDEFLKENPGLRMVA